MSNKMNVMKNHSKSKSKQSLKVLLLVVFVAVAICVSFIVGLGMGYQRGFDMYPTYKQLEWSAKSTADFIGAVNVERRKTGIPLLVEDKRLNASATEKACDMHDRGYFDHKDPEGRDAWHLFEKNGFHYIHAGENIAKDYTHAEYSIDALMQSPSHRANILSSRFTHVGVGICGEYMVQHFSSF